MVTLDSKLVEYINQNVLTKYPNDDKAHDINHINEVIKQGLELALNYDVDINMVYIICAYHDLGNIVDRKLHHLISGQMLKEDQYIKERYDDEKINLMVAAIEDHRSSLKTPIRNIYGEILSSADRVIEVDTIILRTYYYGLKHYQDISFNEQLERIYLHIKNKYQKGGYLKVPILTKSNQENLNKLRNLHDDKVAFIKYTKQLIKKYE